tara:strand:- start:111 stop:1307 length:1197 start_codon:yes stop_codon:yes gene_type:complete
MAGTGFINIPDSTSSSVNRLRLGSSSDYQIFHNGTNAVMDNLTGALFLKSFSSIHLQSRTNNELMASFVPDGEVSLYYDGGTYSTPKLSTTATGIDVTGNIDITDGTLIIDTTPDSPNTNYGLQEALRIDDAGNTVDRGLNIYEYRQGGGRFFSLNYNLAAGSSGTAYTYTQGNYGASTMMMMDGHFKFFVDAANDPNQNVITPTKQFEITTTGANVINNLTVDTDTLFVDSTDNRVGIGTTDPQADLHIKSTGDCILILEGDSGNFEGSEHRNPFIKFLQDGSIQNSVIGMNPFEVGGENNSLVLANSTGSNGGIVFRTGESSPYTNAVVRMEIKSNGTVDVEQNLNAKGGLDVTGKATMTESNPSTSNNLRKITTSTSSPTSSDGADGDIWIVVPS